MSLESESGRAPESEPRILGKLRLLGPGKPGVGGLGSAGGCSTIRSLSGRSRIRCGTSCMSIIGRLGRATTADAARELGISHGLASHHLRQLAKYGFVEQVEGKDHRERPWRLVATSYNWSEATATPEGATAVDVLEQVFAERALEAFLGWQQRRQDWPQAWQQHTGLGESTVYLTQAELAELADAFDALLLRYINERPIDDVASRPAGSVPVSFTLFAVPGGSRPRCDASGGLTCARRGGCWPARRDLRLVLSAGIISLTGDWVLTIGLIYRVYAVTGSTVASALTMASVVRAAGAARRGGRRVRRPVGPQADDDRRRPAARGRACCRCCSCTARRRSGSSSR